MSSTTGPSASGAATTQKLPQWTVKPVDVPKASATGPGGVLTYQDFVKYRQHLEMYLAGYGLEIADFGSSTGRFAFAEPVSEVTEADHKMYVLAFFTTVSNGYKDHPRVFNRLSRVLTKPSGASASSATKPTSRAFQTWEIVLATFENQETRAAEMLQVTSDWSTHVSMAAESPEDSPSFAVWAGRTGELYEALCALKSTLSEEEERLMARQVASKFIQHNVQVVGIYADKASRTYVGDLQVHDVIQQLGARFQEVQGTVKTVLAAKKETDCLKEEVEGLKLKLASACTRTTTATAPARPPAPSPPARPPLSPPLVSNDGT